MEIAKELNGFWVEHYSKEDIKNNMESLNKDMTRIIASYETSPSFDYYGALDDLNDKMSDFLIDDFADAKLYFLRNKVSNKVVSFALFSKDETKESIHLEIIYTHKAHRGAGFGGVLLKSACQDLQKRGINLVTSTVENKNKSSIEMHNTFGENENVELYRNDIIYGRTEFEMDISKINTPKKENKDTFEF